MTDYRAELVRLDAKAGRVHTLADCSVAFQKSVAAPEALDDRDLILIGFVHGEKGVSEARARQQTSTAVLAEAQLTKALPPVPVVTTSVTREPPTTLDEFRERFGTQSVTWSGLSTVLQATDAVLVKELKRLRVRADTLAEANADLRARVLELEAQNAARLVSVR